jgi:hypothetical protein
MGRVCSRHGGVVNGNMKGNYHFEDADRRESNIKLNYEKDRRRV